MNSFTQPTNHGFGLSAAVALAFLAMVLALAPTPSALAYDLRQGPSPEVLEISVASAVVNPGEPVEVSATIRNPFAEETEFHVALLVDEVPEKEQEVRLPGGATRVLKFSVVRSEPGAHLVRLGPQAITFQVLAARFLVHDVHITPAVVAVGEPVAILATVENLGPAPGTFQVPVAVNGQVKEVRTRFLEAGESTTVDFQVVESTPGAYTVLVEEVPGSFTVVGPTVEITVPGSLPISVAVAVATEGSGGQLSLNGDQVSLRSAASGALEVLLPVDLEPGATLASFNDPVSGITYDGATLVLPLRDERFAEVTRLVIQPAAAEGLGTAALLRATTIRLVVPSTLLLLPGVSSPATPLSFSAEVSLEELTLGAPIRLTAGHRPSPETLAEVEVEARAQGMSIAEVVVSATLDISAPPGAGETLVGTVTFGVGRVWFEALGSSNFAVAQLGGNDPVQLLEIQETELAGDQMLLSTPVARGQGRFLLVLLAPMTSVNVERLVFGRPVAIVGEPLEVRAIVENTGGDKEGALLVLRVDGDPVNVEPVQTLSDGVQQAIFYVTVEEPGSYGLEVEGTAGQLVAGLADIPGYIQVSQLTVEPEEAAPGETVTISAIVLNVGPLEVVSEGAVLINGIPEVSGRFSLASGGATEVRFQIAKEQPGSYQIAFLNARSQFAVVTERTPATFQVSEVDVTPHIVSPGESVTVSFSVANEGEEAGVYVASLVINGQEFQQRELLVEGLTAVPTSFTVETEGAGIYIVELSGVRRNYVVVPAEDRTGIVVVELTIQPQRVPSGDLVAVTVELRNRFPTLESGVLVFSVDDEIVEEREVTLAGDGLGREVFLLRRDEAGTYKVSVQQRLGAEILFGELSQSYLVTRILTPPSFEILSLEVSPSPAEPLEPLVISFLLANHGEREGTFDVRMTVDGELEVREEIRLPGQTTRQISLSLEGRPAGTYVLGVNGTRIQITVRAEEPSVQPPEEEPQEKVVVLSVALEQDERPWILAVAAAVALLLVAGAIYWLTLLERASRPKG